MEEKEIVMYFGLAIVIGLIVWLMFRKKDSGCSKCDLIDKANCTSAGFGQPNNFIDPSTCAPVNQANCTSAGFGQPNNFIDPANRLVLGYPNGRYVDVTEALAKQEYKQNPDPTKSGLFIDLRADFFKSIDPNFVDPAPSLDDNHLVMKYLIWSDDKGIYMLEDGNPGQIMRKPTKAYYGRGFARQHAY